MQRQPEPRAPGAAEHVARRQPYVDSPLRHATRATLLMQMQRDAGNRAVTDAFMSSDASSLPASLRTLQLEAAAPPSAPPPAPGPAQGRELGAIWNTQVVVPLARAADRIGRKSVDLRGARADLEGALRTISTLKRAAAADDPNRLRYEIIERRAQGVLELVLQHQGAGKDENQLSEDTRRIRLEAVALGPLLQHRPQAEEDAANSSDVGGGSSADESPRPAEAPNRPQGPAAAPGPSSAAAHGSDATAAPKAAESPEPDTEINTIADLWNFLVVRRLWSGQRALAQSPKFAILDYSTAQLRIMQFLHATPEGHPNRLKLISLEAGVEAIGGQVAKYAPEFASDPIADQAIDAWNTAVAMLEYIPGAQSGGPQAGEEPAAGPAAGAQEPSFTWERPKPARTDDTALERP
jgi:hypothetical protein